METGPLIVSVDGELYIHIVSLLAVTGNFVNELMSHKPEGDGSQEILYGMSLSMAQLHDTIAQSYIDFKFDEITGGVDERQH